MSSPGTLGVLITEVGRALLPLRDATSSPQKFVNFMLKLGWPPEAIPSPIADIGSALDVLIQEMRQIVGAGLSIDGSIGTGGADASSSISMEDIMRVKNAVSQIINGIDAISSAPDAVFSPALVADGFKSKFPGQLVSYLMIEYLTRFHPSWAFALKALGVVKIKYVTPAGNRKPYIDYSIDFSDLPTVVSDPKIVLQNAFGWGTPNFDFGKFISEIDNLFSAIGVDVSKEVIPDKVAGLLQEGVTLPGAPIQKSLKLIFFQRARDTGRLAASINFLYLPPNGSSLPGIAIMPAFNGIVDFKMQLADDTAVTIKSSLDLQGGVGAMIRPGAPIEMILGFNNPGSPSTINGSVEAIAERSNVDNTPTIIFGAADATRLEYQKIGGLGGIRLNSDNTVDFYTEVELKGLKFVFKPSDADGFIQKIVPAEGVGLGFDLAVGFSYLHGFYFRGSSTFEIHLPTHITLGPIGLEGFTLSFVPKDGAFPLSAGATIKASLGPMQAVVENIGMTATISFPDSGGNLGSANFALGFKPPNGVGLSIDASVVKGGGYLYFDFDKEEYAGVLELTIANFIAVKAIGLLSTKMPDGSKGFSLLLIITAEFSPPFQLGYGFTLIGVGGLIGLNRTFLIDPLREGVRTGAINSIMFPQDVVANAPRIISDLKAIFPPYNEHFLIGPMGKLGWGTPSLIKLSFGLIIEIPGNIAILGVLLIALPDESVALVKIQVNFAGILDFDKKMLSFDASLFESRILFMTLEGDMAVRLKWGDQPDFILTVGGFHPSYTPPPLALPTLRRIAINIINESYARIRVECYQAVTSNTVQFGARSEMFFGFDAISLEGHFSFDALFQFSPFHFIIQISSGVTLKIFGMGVFGIRLEFTLEGPTPWRARGKGSISFLFFDVSADFDITWGEEKNTTLPEIQALPKLVEEFKKREQWRTVLPANNNLLVTLRKLNEATESLVLHPSGTLVVNQKLMPLDLDIDKLGNQNINDIKRVTVTKAESDTETLNLLPEEEHFARAQYQKMSDAEKLSKPSFEKMTGGARISIGNQGLRTSKMIRRKVDYEMIIVDLEPVKPLKFGILFKQLDILFNHFLRANSVSKSTLSKSYKKKLQPFDEKLDIKQEGFIVVSNSNNKRFDEKSVFGSQAAAEDYMKQLVTKDPNLHKELQVVSDFEVAGA
jgi:hypothetical protein